jgi:hypothetical protein
MKGEDAGVVIVTTGGGVACVVLYVITHDFELVPAVFVPVIVRLLLPLTKDAGNDTVATPFATLNVKFATGALLNVIAT